MKIDRPLGNLMIGIILALLTATLLLAVQRAEALTGVTQVLMIVSGMTAMAALAAIQRFVEQDRGGPFIHITFNETFLSRSIAQGLPQVEGSSTEKVQKQPTHLPPWDLSAGQLVGADNALALARLRMDIERELRRLAYEVQIDLSARPVGVVGLAHELVDKQALPATLLEALQQIVNVCHKGIHGDEVSDEVTAAVVRVGGQLLERLQSYRHMTKPS